MGAFYSHRFKPSQASVAVANRDGERVQLLPKGVGVPVRIPTVNDASKRSVDVARVASESNKHIAAPTPGLEGKTGDSRQGELAVRG